MDSLDHLLVVPPPTLLTRCSPCRQVGRPHGHLTSAVTTRPGDGAPGVCPRSAGQTPPALCGLEAPPGERRRLAWVGRSLTGGPVAGRLRLPACRASRALSKTSSRTRAVLEPPGTPRPRSPQGFPSPPPRPVADGPHGPAPRCARCCYPARPPAQRPGPGFTSLMGHQGDSPVPRVRVPAPFTPPLLHSLAPQAAHGRPGTSVAASFGTWPSDFLPGVPAGPFPCERPETRAPCPQLPGSRTGHRKDVRVALGAVDWAHNTFTPDF